MIKKTRLGIFVLFSIFLFFIIPLTSSTSLRTGLVGEWRFDEGYGTTAYDASDNGNHGTINGATWTSSGKYGNALEFDGDYDYVRSTQVNQISTVYTASVWIYPYKTTNGNSDQNTHGFTILSEDDSNRHVLWLRARDGEIRVNTFQSGTTGVTTTGANITNNTWHHIVVTAIKGDQSKVYLDGIEIHSWDNDGNSGDWSGDFYIGELRDNRRIVFDGLIDEVRIYNRTLTQDEITSLYNYGDLSCSMTTSCDYTDIFHMSNETNAHAELNNNSNYAYEICCYDSSGFSLGTSCSGDYETLLHLSNQTNAHVEQNNESNYNFNLCINSDSSELNCSYESSCSEYDTCVASISDTTDAHVARCSYYDIQICCKFTNEAPTLNYLNLTPVSPYTTDDLYVNVTCSDPDISDTITAYWNIYKNNSIQPAHSGSTVVTTGVNTLVKTIDSSNTIKHDEWVAELWCGDGRTNTTKHNTSTRTILNSPPSKVNLSYPENNDSLFTNRTPKFNWTEATDEDNDDLTYHLHVSLTQEMNDNTINETNIVDNYYMQIEELEFATYYWRVRAFDSEGYGEWSDVWNFTLVPSVSLILRVDSIDFETMSIMEVNDTINNHPPALLLENDGNVDANVSVMSTPLWSSTLAPLNTSYFQFKAANSTEENSFNWEESQTTWANMSNIYKKIIDTLKRHDENDLARIDIRVEVPSDEPPSSKSANITFWGEEQ